ncbi:MAG: sulfotransferase domain-containing protein [Candidatus Eremiobacteraeota bacterium]|nr:sulfotransferase domain-containing protein [Candidatus Eremiobacteraeota bacterium]
MTFPKCGSQWVRDVMSDPELLRAASARHFSPVGAYTLQDWEKEPQETCVGPIFTVGYEQWKAVAKKGEKALVVLRDPRDIVVSWAFSIAYSHFSDPDVRIVRPVLLSLDLRGKLYLSLYVFFSSAHIFRSWANRKQTNSEYIIRYEELIADQDAAFGKIFQFCGWELDPETIAGSLERHSFAHQSGRQAGTANPFSHFRSGRSEDWKNYFDRSLGELFEQSLPGMLCEFGYESKNDWYAALPETQATRETTFLEMVGKQLDDIIGTLQG